MRNRWLASAGMLLLLLGACRQTATTTSGTPSPTAKSSPSPTRPPSYASEGTVNPGGYGWRAETSAYVGLNGQKFEFGCPPAGQFGAIYGTGTYTRDSSVCTAAVHSAKITREKGGQAVIEVRPGESSYKASDANGVTSQAYEAWDGSFVVVSGAEFAATQEPQTGGYGWAVNAVGLEGLTGQRFYFVCPQAGSPGSLYGTGTYTHDSSVCAAGVHQGKVTVAQGGKVIIEMGGAQTSFTGSAANGITSNDYGQYHGSYTVVG